jgi:hypothetical protein
MKALLASLFVAMLLWGCGGGGGDAGACSGSPEYCAEFADGAESGTGGGLGPVSLAFTKSGTGDMVFDLPANVTRLRIKATFSGAFQTFFVDIGGTPVVRTAVGSSQTPPSFDGTFGGPGGATVEIFGATGVEWVVTQVVTQP